MPSIISDNPKNWSEEIKNYLCRSSPERYEKMATNNAIEPYISKAISWGYTEWKNRKTLLDDIETEMLRLATLPDLSDFNDNEIYSSKKKLPIKRNTRELFDKSLPRKFQYCISPTRLEITCQFFDRERK